MADAAAAADDTSTDRLIEAHGGYVGFSVAPCGQRQERVLHVKCKDNTDIPVQNLPASTLNRICREDAEFERFLNGITAPSVHYQALATELKQVSRAMVHSLRMQNEALSQENQELYIETLQMTRPDLSNFDTEREMRQLEAENTQLSFSLRDTRAELERTQRFREADAARIRALYSSLVDAKRLIECVLPANDALLRHADPVVQTHMTTTNEAYWRMSELLGRIIDEVEEDPDLPEPAPAAASLPPLPDALQDMVPDAGGLPNEASLDIDRLLLSDTAWPS